MDTDRHRYRAPDVSIAGEILTVRELASRRGFLRLSAVTACVTGFAKMAASAPEIVTGPAKFGTPASREVLKLPRTVLSLLSGRKLQVPQAMQYLFDAGFTTEAKLIGGMAVAIAESGLYTAARNWHPEQGYRSADDVITIKGPAEVWRDGAQLHSDRGLCQIASYWHSFFPDAATDDAGQCASIAYQISAGGTDFKIWTSFASGIAQTHFDHSFDGWPALRPLVRRFLNYQASNPLPFNGPTTPAAMGGI